MSSTRTYAQTHDELVEHLRSQVRFLERSAAAFDAGDEDEASRLATSIRVLVHDPPKGRPASLLAQLGVKDDLRYVDTSLAHAGLRPGHPGWDAGLASMQITTPLGPGDPGGRYVPLLDAVPEDRQRPVHFTRYRLCKGSRSASTTCSPRSPASSGTGGPERQRSTSRSSNR